MVKRVRSGFLLFAGLMMILSSFGGCALGRGSWSEGQPVQRTDLSDDFLQKIPEDTPVRLELLSGMIVEGYYLSYTQDTHSIMFRMQQVDAVLSTEFGEDGLLYRIPVEKIVTLIFLESPDHSMESALLVTATLLLMGVLAIVAYAISQINYN